MIQCGLCRYHRPFQACGRGMKGLCWSGIVLYPTILDWSRQHQTEHSALKEVISDTFPLIPCQVVPVPYSSRLNLSPYRAAQPFSSVLDLTGRSALEDSKTRHFVPFRDMTRRSIQEDDKPFVSIPTMPLRVSTLLYEPKEVKQLTQTTRYRSILVNSSLSEPGQA